MNSECYKDPTADHAVANATHDEKADARIERMLKHFRYIATLEGFKISERIVFKDKQTGKVYR